MYFLSILFIISLFYIDMCYSSIIAKSTLVDVARQSGGERCWAYLVARLGPPLAIDLTPNYVLFWTLIIINLLHIDIFYSSISANSTLVDVVRQSEGERSEDV